MVDIFESQIQSKKAEIETQFWKASQQLDVMINQDPEMINLRSRQQSAALLGKVMHFFHLFTSSLCFLIAVKSGLRAAQLAGLLKPHTLVSR
jgi:hypothetical protein